MKYRSQDYLETGCFLEFLLVLFKNISLIFFLIYF